MDGHPSVDLAYVIRQVQSIKGKIHKTLLKSRSDLIEAMQALCDKDAPPEGSHEDLAKAKENLAQIWETFLKTSNSSLSKDRLPDLDFLDKLSLSDELQIVKDQRNAVLNCFRPLSFDH